MTETETAPNWDAFEGKTISAFDHPEEAMAATQAALSESHSAGRPVITPPSERHVTLERGILRDGIWHRDAEVKELTGEDEEVMAAAGDDDFRVFEAILTRGTVCIGNHPMNRAMAGELLLGDRELLVLAVRKATFGDTLTFEQLPCAHCGRLTDLNISLSEMPVRHLEDAAQIEFAVPLRKGRTAWVRLPVGSDQAHLNALRNPTTAQEYTEILNRCVLRVVHADGRTETNPGFGSRLILPDRNKLVAFFSSMQPGPQYSEFTWVHETCGEEVPLPVNLPVLFRGV